jgi:hypothetical protein
MSFQSASHVWLRLQITASLIFLVSCSYDEMSVEEYAKWLYSERSGLHSTVKRAGLSYTMTIQPQCWRAIKDSTVSDEVVVRVRIRSQNEGLPDASFDGVYSLSDYSQRMADLSFHLTELVELRSDDSVVRVAGSQLIQTQGLQPSVDVYLTMKCTEADLLQMRNCYVLFKDDVFHHGFIRWDVQPSKIQRVYPRQS